MDDKESKISAPPPPRVRIRTMESDIKAVQSGGGEVSWIDAGAGTENMGKLKEEPGKEDVPQAEELIFTPTSIISEHSATSQMVKSVKSPTVIESASSFKKIILSVLVIIFIVGLGFILGYKFIFPLIVPSKETPAPQSPSFSFSEVPTVAHESFFIISPDKIEKIKLASVDLTAIKDSLTALSGDNSPANTLKEVVFLTAQKSIDFQLFIQVILPDIPLKMADFFEKDFTSFLYYDEKGAWPGYIAKLKPSTVTITAQTQVKQIESSDNLRNFFIQSVGPANPEGFQNSESNGKPIRYITFPKSNATLSYGWFTRFVDSKVNNYLVISTSDKGLEEAIKRLVK